MESSSASSACLPISSRTAGEWRYQQFSVGPQLPVEVDCTFQVAQPGRVRVELMTHDNLQALLKGRAYESIATSASGTLHQEIGVPGDFALVIVNPDRSQPAHVALRLTLDTSGQSPHQSPLCFAGTQTDCHSE